MTLIELVLICHGTQVDGPVAPVSLLFGRTRTATKPISLKVGTLNFIAMVAGNWAGGYRICLSDWVGGLRGAKIPQPF